MNANSEAVPGAVVEPASIVSLVAVWIAATSSRMRLTTELAFAEARLAAISIALMVLMAVLSAVLILSAWGLILAGFVAATSQFGISLWITLASLGAVHALGGWLLWRKAVSLSRYLEFAATRQQFQHMQEARDDVDTATKSG